ncbi:MAG: hypothetical protein K8T10_03385 [Candidatus Eremiobacteraeota bacterium]|nr:hypothetical protein [Candidatus Eremiobacteraeota bacterium]
MINKTVVLILAVLILCSFFHSGVEAMERKATETLIEKIDLSSWMPESFTVSMDGKHRAYVKKKDGKELAVINGKEEKVYDRILKGPGGYFTFSPDSGRVIYFAQLDGKQFAVVDGKESNKYDKTFIEKNSMSFSADSKKIAYIAEEGVNQFVVIDGKEGKRYKGKITTIAFSLDSSRVYYKVKQDNKEFVVIDGKEEKRYDEMNNHNPPAFSPDSRRFAYEAREGRKWVMVIDGKEGPEHDYIFFGGSAFSPDSRKVAYAAMHESGPLLGNDDILDWDGLLLSLKEHKSPVEERIWSLLDEETKRTLQAWKPGSAIDEKSRKIVLYGLNTVLERKDFYSKDLFKDIKIDWANNFLLNKQLRNLKSNLQLRKFNRFLLELVYPREMVKSHKFYTILNGKEGGKYDLVFVGYYGNNFSSDSRNFMHLARCDDKWFIVENGREGKKYDFSYNQYATYSPDGKQIAFYAGSGKDRFVVVDGKEGKKYDKVVVPPIFSPDSKRITYTVLSGGKVLVVVDEEDGGKYDKVREYIMPIGKDGKKTTLTLREAFGKPFKYRVNCNIRRKMIYKSLMYFVNRFSPDSKRTAYVAEKDGKCLVVIDGNEGVKYDDIRTAPIFSPDSKLAVYTAYREGKEFVVVEGKEGKKYDNVFLNEGNESVLFKLPDTFHYIARKGSNIYLVEEKAGY